MDFSYDVSFRFTGTIDKLNYKLEPEQLSAEDKRKAAVMLAAAKELVASGESNRRRQTCRQLQAGSA